MLSTVTEITEDRTPSKPFPVWELNLELCARTLQPFLGFESWPMRCR